VLTGLFGAAHARLAERLLLMPSSPQASSEANPLLVAAETRAGFGFARSQVDQALYDTVASQGKAPFKAMIRQGKVQVVRDWEQGFEGRGCERYPSGEVYVGEYMAGVRGGRGTFKHANGQILVSAWRQNAPTGEGVQWQPDGSKAARLMHGKPVASCTIEEGAEIAQRLGLPVPTEWLQKSDGS